MTPKTITIKMPIRPNYDRDPAIHREKQRTKAGVEPYPVADAFAKFFGAHNAAKMDDFPGALELALEGMAKLVQLMDEADYHPEQLAELWRRKKDVV